MSSGHASRPLPLPAAEPAPPDQETLFRRLFAPQPLRRTAAQIRKEVRQVRNRDIIDWADLFVTIERSVSVLSSDLLEGTYSPSPPTRYELAKSKGSFRTMTSLNIADAIVYRHLSNHVLELATPYKTEGAFYSRRFERTPVGRTLTMGDENSYYKFFQIWLRYNQYRSQTLLAGIYDCLVVTDISNFFESIQHDLLVEYIAPLGLPRKAMGLLGRLLEAFRPTAGHSPNPRVGIPTDELDCSRQLAHVFLFEHDRDVVKELGAGNYVRWMDDQNIGARGPTDARRVVNVLTRSLGVRRLSLNAGKTQFLGPDEVVAHFQLDANDALDAWEKKFGRSISKRRPEARRELLQLWQNTRKGPSARKGHWDKVLKRLYAAAVKANTSRLERGALQDLIQYPDLDERIFTYFAARNRGPQLLDLFEEYCRLGENMFEGTEAAFFQCALRLNPPPVVRTRLIQLALAFAKGGAPGSCGRPLGRAYALFALYWLGEPVESMVDFFGADQSRALPKEVARTWLACVGALDPSLLPSVHTLLFGHPADDVVRLSRFLGELGAGTIPSLGYYKSRKQAWPAAGEYYDARSWLLLEIASHTRNPALLGRVRGDLKILTKFATTSPERRVAARIRQRLRATGKK